MNEFVDRLLRREHDCKGGQRVHPLILHSALLEIVEDIILQVLAHAL